MEVIFSSREVEKVLPCVSVSPNELIINYVFSVVRVSQNFVMLYGSFILAEPRSKST